MADRIALTNVLYFYTKDQLDKEYKEICDEVNSRHHTEQRSPVEILEDDAYWFACVLEAYSRFENEGVTNDTTDCFYARLSAKANILKDIADHLYGAETLEFSSENFEEAIKYSSLVAEIE